MKTKRKIPRCDESYHPFWGRGKCRCPKTMKKIKVYKGTRSEGWTCIPPTHSESSSRLVPVDLEEEEVVGELCIAGCDYEVARNKFFNYIIFTKTKGDVPNRLNFYVGRPTRLLKINQKLFVLKKPIMWTGGGWFLKNW